MIYSSLVKKLWAKKKVKDFLSQKFEMKDLGEWNIVWVLK
jgi:hypothetical protein